MSSRVLEISQDGRYLHVHRGFIKVKSGGEDIGQMPIDDVCAVVAAAHGITYSQNLLVELAQRNIPLVVTDRKFVPVSVLWPLEGHFNQAAKIDAQLSVRKPLKKRLWQKIVEQKIYNQSLVLEAIGEPFSALREMSRRVPSGDTNNSEAQAARRYWPKLFGEQFRRLQDGPLPNGLLNYGYTIIRSAMARAVVGTGLHPSVGIFHSNRGNPFRLVDDLMEPFRPIVDVVVWCLYQNDPETELIPLVKHQLAGVLGLEFANNAGWSSLLIHIQNLAQSLSNSYLKKQDVLVFPKVDSKDLVKIINATE